MTALVAGHDILIESLVTEFEQYWRYFTWKVLCEKNTDKVQDKHD